MQKTEENMKTEELLNTVIKKIKEYKSTEKISYNILSAIENERDEAHVHSKIIYFLLEGSQGEGLVDDFFYLFLKEIGIPEKHIDSEWRISREQVFEDGRIDFVIENKSFCAVIEMKIDAQDGWKQLERYERFCKRKRKDYSIYYLTLDGKEPDKHSVQGINRKKLFLISFQNEILGWLRSCMSTVQKGSYKYSFLKQYEGAVMHIIEEEALNISDLFNSKETGKAALCIKRGFDKRMSEVKETLFEKVGTVLKKKSEFETEIYTDTVELVIDNISIGKKDIAFFFVIGINCELYADFSFFDLNKNRFISFKEVEKLAPKFYKIWMDEIDKLSLPKVHTNEYTKWYYIENNRGEKFDFRKNNDAALELLDKLEMNIQSKYISEKILKTVLKPLSQYTK